MRVIALSMVVSNWDRNAFAPQETYFKLRPIVKWRTGALSRTWSR